MMSKLQSWMLSNKVREKPNKRDIEEFKKVTNKVRKKLNKRDVEEFKEIYKEEWGEFKQKRD